MTIQDCILSGKPFKIQGMNDYLYAGTDGYFHWYEDDQRVMHFPVQFILSDKWHLIIPENVIPFRKKNS